MKIFSNEESINKNEEIGMLLRIKVKNGFIKYVYKVMNGFEMFYNYMN